MREHNRLAQLLKNQNPQWNDDEKLYQEARRIVIAEYQHIIYKEWLPQILGLPLMKKTTLYPLEDGYVDNYKEDDFDPRITNEFAVAAFRFGHSLIPSSFDKITRNRQSRALDLKTVFFEPRKLFEEPGMYFLVINH